MTKEEKWDFELSEWTALMESLDDQISDLSEKVENGRVHDAENERVRIEWNRLLLKALKLKKESLRTAPLDVKPEDVANGNEVYILSGGGLYKIGYSQNAENRAKSLQSSSPVEIQLIYKTPPIEHAEKIEYELHKEFEQSKSHGEWFDLSENQLSQAIGKLKEFE